MFNGKDKMEAIIKPRTEPYKAYDSDNFELTKIAKRKIEVLRNGAP